MSIEMNSAAIPTAIGDTELIRGGAGAPLVYLHSFIGEGHGVELLDHLAADHEVFAPQLPGFGASEGIESIDDMEDLVFHVLDLWDALGLKAPVVVGTSLGAWLAAELASRYPDAVSTLVLVNPLGLHLPGAPVGDIFGRSRARIAEDLFVDQTHPVAAEMHTSTAFRSDPARVGELTFDMIKPIVQTMTATARIGWDPYLHNPKLRSRLRRITARTLVVRGAEDTLVPAAHAQTYASEIPAATLKEVTGGAHLVSLEQPEAVAGLIRDAVGAA